MCRCCIMLTYFVYKLVGWVAFAPVLVTLSGVGALRGVALCPLPRAMEVSGWETSPCPHARDACGLSPAPGCCQHTELWCGFAQPLHGTNT